MKRNPILIVLLTAVVLGGLLFVVLFVTSSLSGRRTAAALSVVGTDRVALVKISGMLISSEHIVEELSEYTDDPSIKAIVIRIDSPGGGVVVSQEIYNAVTKAKKEGKKVVVSMGSVAASGGYYVAAAADKIVANPGTLTGSIGVIMEFANVEKLLEKIGVKGVVVKAGEYKDMGSPFRDMTPQERKLLQDVIDDVHNQFVKAVAEGRNLPESEVRAIADGRIFTGQQALALRLVDQMGDLDDSIRLAGSLAGIKGKPKVVEKRKKIPFFEYLKEESASWIADVIQSGISRSSVALQYLYR
ncbi:MAG TPA: signal peptide peptidase SppA [Nitrospirota bacterium]|nr:signal peptide peptidase SppA [Nitrospirota bacterium]